jgi:hypothetical protein
VTIIAMIANRKGRLPKREDIMIILNYGTKVGDVTTYRFSGSKEEIEKEIAILETSDRYEVIEKGEIEKAWKHYTVLLKVNRKALITQKEQS